MNKDTQHVRGFFFGGGGGVEPMIFLPPFSSRHSQAQYEQSPITTMVGYRFTSTLAFCLLCYTRLNRVLGFISPKHQLIRRHTSSLTAKKPKKKNFLIRFEEATYKQNLEEQCFQESSATQQCWQNATQYDSDVEQLFSKYFR